MSATATDAIGTDRPIAKPDPTLPSSRGMLGNLVDLLWLVRVVAGAAPRHTALWCVQSLIGGLVVPGQLWLTKLLVDGVQHRLQGGEAPWLWWQVGGYAALAVLDLTATRFGEYLDAVVRERGGEELQARVFAQATALDLETYEHQGFYDQVSRLLTETETSGTHLVQLLISLGWRLPRLVAYAGSLLVVDWRLFLLATVPVLPGVYSWFFTGGVYWRILVEQTRERRLADYLASLLTSRQAAKEVRLFGTAPYLRRQWETYFWQTRNEARRRMLRVAIRQRGVTFGGVLLSITGLLFAPALLPADLGAGTYVIIFQSFLNMTNSIFNTSDAILDLGRSSGFASDLRAFLALPSLSEGSAANDPPGECGRIELSGVRYSYPGTSVLTIDGIDLDISPGETVALVGENGAGKTTLIKLILGLYGADAGTVRLDGGEVAAMSPDERARHMAAVFQHFTRYPFSLTENVTLLPATRDPDGLAGALTVAGLGTLAERLPAGADTVLAPDLGGVDLSGGQWQRLAIARAGWRDADVLILDEPTAALDPVAEVAIFRRFARLAEGRTTVLVSHRLGMARLADRVLVLRNGRIVESGSHDALIAEGGEYAEMWQAQARWYR